MSETQSIRYWFALIFSTIISIIFALAIIVLSWYLLWKFVLSRFGVLRALFQLNQNDKPAAPAAPAAVPTPSRRQHIRRE